MANDSKSISGSQSIPFSRSHNDAFQDMTAFSPPVSTESWVPLRRQQQQSLASSQEEKNKSKFPLVPRAHQLEEACKSYIETSEIAVKSNKALGVDDHFKSMVCSKNLLKVCEKLMTDKDTAKGNTTIGNTFIDDEDDFDTELSLMNEKSRMEFYRSKYGNRRNSQSLPSSPKMERKNTSVNTSVPYNPYFTISQSSHGRPETSISFLTNLFGISARKPDASLIQKTEVVDTTTKCEPQQSNAAASGDSTSLNQEKRPKMIPQPHEYREMNFWSPTSM